MKNENAKPKFICFVMTIFFVRKQLLYFLIFNRGSTKTASTIKNKSQHFETICLIKIILI